MFVFILIKYNNYNCNHILKNIYICGVKNVIDMKIKTEDRDKIIDCGTDGATDVELLSVMTGSIEIATRLLEEGAGSLRRVVTMSIDEMCGIKGIGRVKASEMAAAFEIYRRAQREVNNRKFIYNADDVFNVMVADIGLIPHEELWVVYVGAAKRLLARKRISQGGLNGTDADRRIIFRYAYALGAQELYICHNHPSGCLAVSDADVSMTRQMSKACALLGFRLSDHVVVTSSSYMSMRERGLM